MSTKARPQAKNITDVAMLAYLENAGNSRSYEDMAAMAGSAPKVIERVLERLAQRGYVDYGVSLRTCWLTQAGVDLLDAQTDSWSWCSACEATVRFYLPNPNATMARHLHSPKRPA